MSVGQEIVEKAKEFIGYPYLAGGASPDGFDSPGFVYYVLKQLGINAPRNTAALLQQGDTGTGEAGDVICFNGLVGFSDGQGNIILVYKEEVAINMLSDISRWEGKSILGIRRYR